MRISADIDARRVSRAFRRAPAIMTNRVDQSVHRAAKELAREARGNAPKAFSNLAGSINEQKLAPMDYLVGPSQQHGVHVELGTRGGGGFPPVQAIEDWVNKRGIGGGAPRDAAWAIAHKIQRQGTPAQPFMGPARDSLAGRARALIADGVRAGLRAAGLA